MELITYFLLILLLISGCSKGPQMPCEVKELDTHVAITVQNGSVSENGICYELNTTDKNDSQARVLFNDLPKTHLLKSDFNQLPNWNKEDYTLALEAFINSCRSKSTQSIYEELCAKAVDSQNPKIFLQNKFIPYEIKREDANEDGLLTGYYEPQLNGSLVKTSKFKYPIYETPEDLISVDLSSIYPDLKNYRLRGRVQGKKLIPYYTRKETKSEHIPSRVICYTDSKLDLFFLEIQGSGRVVLRDGTNIFIGYDNQNGHKYRAIGQYLVKIHALKYEDVSLQSIRAWLLKHPKRIDEVLNYNKSVVYFKQTQQSASGALGLCLTPKRSIAVDRSYIPLGSMLYLSADIKDKLVSKVVVAQDTGGAIKGALRADMFFGYGKEARDTAGELKSLLKLWILLPKNKKEVI